MHDENYYKNIMAKILNKSLENNPMLAKELIISMFEDPELIKRAELICDTYKKEEYKNSILVIKPVKINALSLLNKICKREKIGFIPILFNKQDATFKSGEYIKVLILSLQESDFNRAYMEALMMSGDMASADMTYLTKLEDTYRSNSIIKLKNITKEIKQRIIDQIKKLPPMMKFCIFSEGGEIGNIAFFSKTQEMKIETKDGLFMAGPYPALDILTLLLIRSYLPERTSPEYEKVEKYNRELLKVIRMELETIEKPYIIPCYIKRDHTISPILKDVIEYKIEDEPDILIDGMKKRLKTPNLTFVVLSEKDYLKFRINRENEIDLSKSEFFEERELPEYVDPEISAKNAFLQKIKEALKEIQSGTERDSIIKEIIKEQKEEISLDKIVSAIIDKRNDWESELFKDETTKDLEKDILDKVKDIECEYIPPKEPERNFVMEHEIEREFDEDELEL